MGADDWYRNKIWDKTTEANFEDRLKRSRGAFHKAQYLRIQASYLLSSKDENLQEVGIRLMNRMIIDYPTEEFCTAFGHEQLGDYYFEKGDFNIAEEHYKIVVEHYAISGSRGGTSTKADLKLAKTYLVANKVDQYISAYEIGKHYPLEKLLFNDDKFYYADLMAHICDKLDRRDEAREYAKIAIEISKITQPVFNRHKNLGLVKVAKLQLEALEQIIYR